MTLLVARSRAVLAALCVFAGCHPSGAARPHVTTLQSCDYRVELSAQGLARVKASCKADGPIAFQGNGQRFRAPRKQVSYVVDLAKLAGHGHDFDSAERVGASFVAPMSSVLLVPEPLTREIPVTVQITASPPLNVAVGLQRGTAPGQYRLMAHEIPVATYFSFGKLQQRTLDIDGRKVEVNVLDGALDESFDDLNAWITKSATAVRDFYRAFPVPRVNVTVIPTPGRDSVVFGKVLPESEPGVALLVGQHATRKALYSDWILVHELFHLGFPSFYEEGKWLDEGLATYYEPIIRVRAGLYTETELWDELSSKMPQGLPAFTQLGLEKADDFRGIYWGGAIACLVADVAARKRDPQRGLEVGLVALRDAGGTASEVWTLAEVIEAVDHTLGAPTLGPIFREHAQRGSAFDLSALFVALGVNRDAKGAVQLSDSAPLAAVRRAITAQQ
jgi:hypothetical protein